METLSPDRPVLIDFLLCSPSGRANEREGDFATVGCALIHHGASSAMELNKLANNVALGRDMAGVHWRSDAEQALLLGENVTISILRDQRRTYNEPFSGFTFTRFNGVPITV